MQAKLCVRGANSYLVLGTIGDIQVAIVRVFSTSIRRFPDALSVVTACFALTVDLGCRGHQEALHAQPAAG